MRIRSKVSAVSMILMIFFISMIPMIFFISRSWWFQRCFRGVNDTAETSMRIRSKVSAVSLTPRKWFQQCHRHRLNSNNVDYFGEYEAICKTILAFESGPLVGLIGEKKQRSKISWHGPFKIISARVLFLVIYILNIRIHAIPEAHGDKVPEAMRIPIIFLEQILF
jgi:hypothetical protein